MATGYIIVLIAVVIVLNTILPLSDDLNDASRGINSILAVFAINVGQKLSSLIATLSLWLIASCYITEFTLFYRSNEKLLRNFHSRRQRKLATFMSVLSILFETYDWSLLPSTVIGHAEAWESKLGALIINLHINIAIQSFLWVLISITASKVFLIDNWNNPFGLNVELVNGSRQAHLILPFVISIGDTQILHAFLACIPCVIVWHL